MFTILLASALLAASLDSMSAPELKETGVSKLTPQEKAALQNWIDGKKPAVKPATSKKKQAGPMMQDNLQNGRYIRLTDNSLWEIRSSDTPITQGWITAVEIKIEPSGDKTYPNKLTNTLTGSAVLARKTANIPPAKQEFSMAPQFTEAVKSKKEK